MKYCLIEKWADNYSLPDDSKAIALTPEASYQLQKCNIDYLTFKDYFSSGEITGDTENYFNSQRLWFEEFDKFIKDIFPEAKSMNVHLASLFLYNIKYLVDSVITTTRIIYRFIDITNPSKIWFISDIYGEDKIDRNRWFCFGESSFSRLIGPICQKKQISLERIDSMKEQNLRLSNFKQPLTERFNSEISFKMTIQRCFQNIISIGRNLMGWYRRFPHLLNRLNFFNKRKNIRILILKTNNYIYDFCRDCYKAGFQVFFKNEKYFVKSSPTEDSESLSCDWVMDKFIRSNIMGWINEQCCLDVSSILYSRFRYLLWELFPKTLRRIKMFADFYDKNSIDFVVNYSFSTEDDFAAIEAAKVSKKTKRAGFSHGADVYATEFRFFSDYSNFDLYFTSTAGEAAHVKELAESHNNSTIQINEHPYFLNKFSSISKTRNQKKVLCKGAKPVVLFVPIMRTERMHLPIEKIQPFQWDYFKWHYALIDYFLSQSNYHFVWKSISGGSRYGDSICQFLKDKNSENISFSSAKLSKWFTVAERVICDVPSTAFFESIFSGVPAMTLYRPEDQTLREDGYHAFGSCVQPYTTIEEGLQVVEEFLYSDPEKYTVSLSNRKVFVPDILRNYLAERQLL